MILPNILVELWQLFKQRPRREKPTLFQQFEDAYYDKFPEDWPVEGPLFAIGPQYERILSGEQNYTDRTLWEGETWSRNAITRGKRNIWQVGHIYYVAKEFSPTKDSEVRNGNEVSETWTIIPERKVEDALGRIRLTGIDPIIRRLYFEVIK